MLDNFSLSDVLMIVFLFVMFTVMMYFFMLLLRHMQRQNKELISTMRDSYEKQIYVMNDRLTASIERWQDVNHLLISSQAIQPAVDPMQRVRFSTFLKANGVREEEIEPDPKLVFVLTPFNNRFDEVFNRIRLTCQDVGLTCLRGDEEFLEGDILSHILRLMCRASIIIANIEGRNANVFYELGLAHAMDKSTLLLAKTVENLPIDVKSKKIIVYQHLSELSPRLKDELLRLAYVNRSNEAVTKQREQFVRKIRFQDIDYKIRTELLRKQYRLYLNPAVPGKSKSKIMEFEADGEITKGRNENEDRWRIRNGHLELVDSEGQVHSRFKYDLSSDRFNQVDDPESGTMRKHKISGQYMVPET